MVIELYNNISDDSVVDKSLSNKREVTGHLRDVTNIEYPVVYIEDIYTNFNYCYIPQFSRYYYVQDILIKGKTTCLKCEIDVLMTYKDDIRNSYGLIVKGKGFNPYFNGGYDYENRDTYRQLNFQNPFNSEGNIILITAGMQTGGSS